MPGPTTEATETGRTVRSYAQIAFGMWFLFGLLPATWALGRASIRDDFDLNAAWGAFGDSFAVVTSVLTTSSLLIVAYQLLRDREQRKQDELQRREDKRQQAELAMLPVLLQAKLALKDELAKSYERAIASANNGQTWADRIHEKLKADRIEEAFNNNIAEIRQIMLRAETLVGLKPEKP